MSDSWQTVIKLQDYLKKTKEVELSSWTIRRAAGKPGLHFHLLTFGQLIFIWRSFRYADFLSLDLKDQLRPRRKDKNWFFASWAKENIYWETYLKERLYSDILSLHASKANYHLPKPKVLFVSLSPKSSKLSDRSRFLWISISHLFHQEISNMQETKKISHKKNGKRGQRS